MKIGNRTWVHVVPVVSATISLTVMFLVYLAAPSLPFWGYPVPGIIVGTAAGLLMRRSVQKP